VYKLISILRCEPCLTALCAVDTGAYKHLLPKKFGMGGWVVTDEWVSAQ